jgi:hypothetical protein
MIGGRRLGGRSRLFLRYSVWLVVIVKVPPAS